MSELILGIIIGLIVGWLFLPMPNFVLSIYNWILAFFKRTPPTPPPAV